MAAVAIGTLHPDTPAGMEYNAKGQAATAITKGQLLIVTAAAPGAGYLTVWDKATTATTDPGGIALMDCAAGGTVSVGIVGEMDGFTGLTPGAFLYPSASVAGGIDTSKPAGAVERMRALSATRIHYAFV
jgi:hypothetical protein